MQVHDPAMLRGICLAIVAGTVAGTAFPVIFLAIAILGSSSVNGDLQSAIWIAAMSMAIPLILVTASSFLLGVPATLALKMLHWENETAYIVVGGMLGFLVPGTILAFAEESIAAFFHAIPAGLLGAVSGAMTGRTWWRQYRAALVDPEF